MFNFLPDKPNIEAHRRANDSDRHRATVNKNGYSIRVSSAALAATLSGVLLLSGCQQQTETQPAPEDSNTIEQTNAEDSKPMPQSDSAAARIKQFQPIYVTQAQGLQRRLQAEYESLQAADASDSTESLLQNGVTTDANNGADVKAASGISDSGAVNTNDTSVNTSNNATPETSVATTDDTSAAALDAGNESEAEVDINTSTEVGERDLTVLKRISLEPRKPVLLTEDQIIENYQQAMEALYQPVTTPLSAEDVDTLINIATLVPQLFEHAEIAGRVSAKSPALARLIIQHQVWEQIEAQQVKDMQQMKLNQQQEFETLMAKFNDTIKGYDEQIAKYEQTLKEFQ